MSLGRAENGTVIGSDNASRPNHNCQSVLSFFADLVLSASACDECRTSLCEVLTQLPQLLQCSMKPCILRRLGGHVHEWFNFCTRRVNRSCGCERQATRECSTMLSALGWKSVDSRIVVGTLLTFACLHV